ncbi:MAG: TetR/AcrR family transcriptional regulator C-terminal domain-containing protein [Leptospiraceae bacterium]|nr:TetR/AcrR family transcriptional regulator C-terminal domain-containing protein [Leptospiraceae bacterium]
MSKKGTMAKKGSTAARRAGRKGVQAIRITPESIVSAAVEMADRDGMESLSMRKLAARIGVEAMSLYHHVASREALLDGMVDRVFRELALPDIGETSSWKAWLIQLSGRMRSILLQHPWAVGLLDSRRNPGPATLQYQDSRLGRLRKAGFSVAMAAHAVAIQDSYVYGFVMQELALPFENGADLGELVDDIRSSMEEGKFPHLEEMMEKLVLQKGYSFSSEFEFGLQLLVEGLATRLKSDK